MNQKNIHIVNTINEIPKINKNHIKIDLNEITEREYESIFKDSFSENFSENADISLAIDLGLSDADFEEFFDYDSAAREYIRDNLSEYKNRYMHEYDIENEDDINEDDIIDEYASEVAEDMKNDYSYYQYYLEPFLNSWELTLFLLNYLIENRQFDKLFENIDYIMYKDKKYDIKEVYLAQKEGYAIIIFK